MQLNSRSEKNLQGVHQDLVKVVRLAAERCPPDIGLIVTEGLRTPERQQQLVAAGSSKTLKSRHLTGHAVDLAATVGGKVKWDYALYVQLAEVMKNCAKELNVPIEWGGDWKTFKDGPHYQLPWSKYP